ncbi:MAG: hypothetical protein IJI44_06055 [Erysipelotrichaceae bacterium]|nr:hypothetical protein [Erysipelotrichaceae bacterium]
MAAIAYITDSKMLELHRLNRHKTINFWRISSNINFSDFMEGDLVFFLSKDKEHRKGNEKGIVGFGRLAYYTVGSIKSMWDKYGVNNGYRNLEEFKEAIQKVAKDKKLPKKISGFYLENVTFFQPVYLSECGMQISDRVESYIYLKQEEVVVKLLALAKEAGDIWSGYSDNLKAIRTEELLYALFRTHRKIRDIITTEKTAKKAKKILQQYAEEKGDYRFIQGSVNELYKADDYNLEIVFYRDKNIDDKLLYGQALLYRYYMNKLCDAYYRLRFRCVDEDDEMKYILNSAE